MKKIITISVLILSICLCVFSNSATAYAKTKKITTDGMYAIDGLNIKSIKKKDNKITVKTYGKKQLYRYDNVSGRFTYFDNTEVVFQGMDETIKQVVYYHTGKYQDVTMKELNQLIKTSKSHKEDYANSDKFDKYSPFKHPQLVFYVDDGIVYHMVYHEGEIDIMDFK